MVGSGRMGEAKRRSRSKKEIIAQASRCVYCASKPTTVDHMPPLGLFVLNGRPSGWEFACCSRYNEGTRGADAVAQFLAMIEPTDAHDQKSLKFRELIPVIRKRAPGVYEDLFSQAGPVPVLMNRNGLLHRAMAIAANGPLVRAALNLFVAKAAMATFHELTGRPLALNGVMITAWFLNSMSQAQYDAVVGKMPAFAQLQQGAKTSGGQFSMRYNTNERDVVAAVLSLHQGLHILTIATDNEEVGPNLDTSFLRSPSEYVATLNLARPGLPELDH